MIAASCALFAFLSGAVPVGQIVARYVADVDLSTAGSGNIGATNVARVVGRKAGLFTLVVDVLKGVVPVLVAQAALGDPHLAWGCGVLAVLGHCYTPYLRWRGGKGVATSLGVLVAATPAVALGGLGVWAVVVALTRRSSVGALVALPTVVGLAWLWAPGSLAWTVLLAAVVLLRHVDNIRRLLAGAELGLSSSRDGTTTSAAGDAETSGAEAVAAAEAQNADSSIMI